MTAFGQATITQARLRDWLPWAAALLLALLHMLLFTRGYRMSADDAAFIDTFMAGHAAILDAGSTEAHTNGRIGMYLLRPLNTVAAYLAGYYPMRLLFVALHYLNFILFAMLASRMFKASVAPMLFVVLVVMHPLAFEHMPPNAYPLQNTLPFLLILASRLLLFQAAATGTGKWRVALTLISYLGFALGMFFSEYAIIFGTALLLTQYLARLLHPQPAGSLGKRIGLLVMQRTVQMDALVVVAVVGAYLLFRWFNPSHYDGNSPDGIFHVARMAVTAAGHIASGTVFGQAEFLPPALGIVSIATSMAVGLLAAFCAFHFFPRVRGLCNAGSMLAIAACGAVYAVFPTAMTLKQQSWCIDSGACGFVDSRVAYYWVGLGVLAALALLMARIGNGRHRTQVLVAISMCFGLVSTFTYANNLRQAEHMQLISQAWERARILACLPDRIPQSDESLKGLIDPRSQVMFHPYVWQQAYWRHHVGWLSEHAHCPESRRGLQGAYRELVEGMQPLDLGERVKFSRTASHSYLATGWSPEPWGVWSVGHRATIKAGLPDTGHDLELVMRALRHDVNGKTQPVVVEVNGTRVAALSMTNEARDYTVKIPAALLEKNKGSMVLALVIPDPVSPRQAGSGVDTRQLGVGLVEVEFSAVE